MIFHICTRRIATGHYWSLYKGLYGYSSGEHKTNKLGNRWSSTGATKQRNPSVVPNLMERARQYLSIRNNRKVKLKKKEIHNNIFYNSIIFSRTASMVSYYKAGFPNSGYDEEGVRWICKKDSITKTILWPIKIQAHFSILVFEVCIRKHNDGKYYIFSQFKV